SLLRSGLYDRRRFFDRHGCWFRGVGAHRHPAAERCAVLDGQPRHAHVAGDQRRLAPDHQPVVGRHLPVDLAAPGDLDVTRRLERALDSPCDAQVALDEQLPDKTILRTVTSPLSRAFLPRVSLSRAVTAPSTAPFSETFDPSSSALTFAPFATSMLPVTRTSPSTRPSAWIEPS